MEKTISSCGKPVPNKKKTVRPPILYRQLATSLNCPCFRRTIFILHGSIRDDVCGELGLHDATIRRKIWSLVEVYRSLDYCYVGLDGYIN